MKKKILFLLVALALSIGLATIPAQADSGVVVTPILPSQDLKAGKTVPIKFSLTVDPSIDPNQPYVYDEGLSIKIWVTNNPGVVLQTSTYGHGATSYRISNGGKLYRTSFKTNLVPVQYTVEVWKGSTWLGGFYFKTVK